MSNFSLLKTGDLLFFEGCGYTSKLIKIFTDSQISHVGIVWQCPITNQLYIWETGDISDTCLPIITRYNSPLNAAHLVPIQVKLKQHYKKIFVRRLFSKKPLNTLELDKFIATHLGKLYTANLVALWTQRCNPSILSLPFLEDEDEDYDNPSHTEWMCSQLTLWSYYHIGIIQTFDAHTSSITPGDMFEDIVTHPDYEFSKPELLWQENK